MAGSDIGSVLLDAIYDEVDHRLNRNGDECWNCGGDGYVHDCIDGCCVDADIGCELCSRPCIECRLYAGSRAKAIREEVIKSGNLDVAVAWLKSIGRWRDDITMEDVQRQMEAAKAALDQQAVSGTSNTMSATPAAGGSESVAESGHQASDT